MALRAVRAALGFGGACISCRQALARGPAKLSVAAAAPRRLGGASLSQYTMAVFNSGGAALASAEAAPEFSSPLLDGKAVLAAVAGGTVLVGATAYGDPAVCAKKRDAPPIDAPEPKKRGPFAAFYAKGQQDDAAKKAEEAALLALFRERLEQAGIPAPERAAVNVAETSPVYTLTTAAPRAASDADLFQAAATYTGLREGFAFKTGEFGPGYYYDALQGYRPAFPISTSARASADPADADTSPWHVPKPQYAYNVDADADSPRNAAFLRAGASERRLMDMGEDRETLARLLHSTKADYAIADGKEPYEAPGRAKNITGKFPPHPSYLFEAAKNDSTFLKKGAKVPEICVASGILGFADAVGVSEAAVANALEGKWGVVQFASAKWAEEVSRRGGTKVQEDRKKAGQNCYGDDSAACAAKGAKGGRANALHFELGTKEQRFLDAKRKYENERNELTKLKKTDAIAADQYKNLEDFRRQKGYLKPHEQHFSPKPEKFGLPSGWTASTRVKKAKKAPTGAKKTT